MALGRAAGLAGRADSGLLLGLRNDHRCLEARTSPRWRRGSISPPLDRHLADGGASFRAEIDAIRYAVAREPLSLTDLPAGEMSAALSDANPAAFTRGFRRWSGVTPSPWRGKLRREPERRA